ncbi:PREDICTED: nicotinamide N-methyltransferase-like [Nanorana parkeri]|uniref:nicotinamide N-methyltransferase-like n=1 Tax=Nanorana parkeri TaxID=125878 RepID=UPI00085407A8|nr:PREDICTED: nicotinamide N-methyltransferase-like [Nanorana parkeri]
MATPLTSSQTYIDKFDPLDYYKAYYQSEGTITEEWVDFVLRNLHETFTTGGVKGDLLIDFGAGPTIYHLLSACEAFNNIITSDFLEQNRTQLQKWLKKDPDALDWTHIVKRVCELEGNSDNESCKKKEEKLRRMVTKVLKCDALKENPYDPVKMPQADCLISCLCLEAACKDVESFTNVLRNFKSLIKPGGHIVLQSVLNCTYYFVGQNKFFCLPISRKELEAAFKEAGYEIMKIKVIPFTKVPEKDVCDQDSYYFVHARKPCSQG